MIKEEREEGVKWMDNSGKERLGGGYEIGGGGLYREMRKWAVREGNLKRNTMVKTEKVEDLPV